MIMEKVVAFVVEIYKLVNDQIVKFGFNQHPMSEFYTDLIKVFSLYYLILII